MQRLSRRSILFLVPVVSALVLAAPTTVDARERLKVVWTDVELPQSDRQAPREKELRAVLKREARRVQWGAPPDGLVEVSIKVTEFSVQHRTDVVRVTCTAVGRLANGPQVKTHFSFGGRPDKAAALESQMLLLVGRGVVTRLSSISRERYPRHSDP
jgi:hypothetical protein